MKKAHPILLGILIATTFASTFKIPLLGFNANLSQLVVCLMLPIAGIELMKGLRYHDRHWNFMTLIVLLYFFTNFISSLAYAPDKMWSLRGSADILSYVIIYLVTKRFITDFESLDGAVSSLKMFNLLSVLFGLFSLLYSWLPGERAFIGVSTGHVEFGFPSIRSLSFEPNFFAQITAVVSCFYLAQLLLRRRGSSSFAFFFLMVPAILFSYTRGVYASLLIAFLAMVVINIKRTSAVLKRVALPALGLLMFVAAISMISPTSDTDIFSAFAKRVANMTNFEQGSGAIRDVLYFIGIKGFEANPLLGNGTLSANTMTINRVTGDFGYISGTQGWLTGAWIQSLNDTGVFGFVVLLSLFLVPIFKNYRIFKHTKNNRVKEVSLAFFGGNVLMLVACQISSSLWFAFPWIYWGINAAFIDLVKNGEYDAPRTI
ncbi:MAG: O-antigen ligase family protein [Nitrososphaerota archaeon]|nr:O-antigen ligase family protein [Nitrososphaerota archaeon]